MQQPTTNTIPYCWITFCINGRLNFNLIFKDKAIAITQYTLGYIVHLIKYSQGFIVYFALVALLFKCHMNPLRIMLLFVYSEPNMAFRISSWGFINNMYSSYRTR